jgi:hypothetical protein
MNAEDTTMDNYNRTTSLHNTCYRSNIEYAIPSPHPQRFRASLRITN